MPKTPPLPTANTTPQLMVRISSMMFLSSLFGPGHPLLWSKAGLLSAAILLMTVGGSVGDPLWGPPTARAQISIDIEEGRVEPIPIAIPAPSTTAENANLTQNFIRVLRSDLGNSGLLQLIDTRRLDRQPFNIRQIQTLVGMGAEAALILTMTITESQITVQSQLWNTITNAILFSRNYSTPTTNWRKAAHVVADDVYHQLTGEPPYFNSRILFIAETGPLENREKKLAIMDQDGHNVQHLTDGRQLVLTPRIAQDGERIAYLSIFNRQAAVYLFNLRTAAFERLGEFEGMTFAPRFSPDSRNLVMSHAQDGNSEIYLFDLQTKSSERLTNHPAIDTSPSFSPDGRQIAFTSNREGTAQIHVMNLVNRSVRRISLGDGLYHTPVWSPRGDLIAFTKIRRGTFYIGVMNSDGTGERLLTSGFLVEGPDWSPNGRTIIFTKQADRNVPEPRLHVIDVSGYYDRQLPTPTAASDPSWAPQQ